jgi:hypothetical protein
MRHRLKIVCKNDIFAFQFNFETFFEVFLGENLFNENLRDKYLLIDIINLKTSKLTVIRIDTVLESFNLF